MSYTNYPSAGNTPAGQPNDSKKDNRKLIYGVLIVALLGTWGYIIYDKNKTNDNIAQLQTQTRTTENSRDSIQEQYNDIAQQFDTLKSNNLQLQGQLSKRDQDIKSLRGQIESELKKSNRDKAKLQSLINQLRGKVNDYETQISQLKAENEQLSTSNKQLTVQRDSLNTSNQTLTQNLSTTQAAKAQVEDVASTLHASNFNIAAIDVKSSGKEKTTTTAKRADLFRISFQLDENRIAPSGEKELYVVVTGPDGKPITTPSTGSGTFQTRDEGEKVFTNKVDVQYVQGQTLPVSFDWKIENNKYQTGNYTIQIYHNGYKIGEGTRSLKKGGLFS